MLAIGSEAPGFELPDHLGRAVSLPELLAQGPLVLYFYPADFTPGCTREACSIRDLHSELLAAGLRVAGISPQDPASHARFRDQYELPFVLLSDPDKVAIRRYDVDGPFSVGVRRATFLINQGAIIEDAVLADLRIDRHRAFIENAIRLFAADR